MLNIQNTENLAGISISGDFYDLDNLYESLHAITIDEFSEKHTEHIDISIRLLGFCYDIRHAIMGDRDIDLVENNMDDEKMKFHSTVTPKSNVYYKFNYLYPEMMFVILAINVLVELRIGDLGKSRFVHDNAFDRKVIWDDAIATVRNFQAKFMKCVRETLSDNSFARWLGFMNSDYIFIEDIASQYIDLQNIEYLKLSKENRLKKLNTISKRIAEFRSNADHREIKEVVEQAAREHGCARGDIQLAGIEYPEDIEW